jgi:tetratricopeptide (TPR) repeat protein
MVYGTCMSAPDDEAAQLRKVFRATLANSGWGPETIGRANSLALALWETEQRDEAESLLAEVRRNVNLVALGNSGKGRSAIEDLAFALSCIDAATEADVLYKRVIDLATRAGNEIDSRWWSKWAHVKRKLGKWDEATSLYRTALDTAVRLDGPQSNAATIEYYFLADALRCSGAIDESLKVADMGLERFGEERTRMSRPLLQARILALRDLGATESLADAIRQLRVAATSWPKPQPGLNVEGWLQHHDLADNDNQHF